MRFSVKLHKRLADGSPRWSAQGVTKQPHGLWIVLCPTHGVNSNHSFLVAKRTESSRLFCGLVTRRVQTCKHIALKSLSKQQNLDNKKPRFLGGVFVKLETL